MHLIAVGWLTLLLASGPAGPGTIPVECGAIVPIVCGSGRVIVPVHRGGTGPPSWGFSIQTEGGPTSQVRGFATRDACWRVHKTLTDAHPELTLGVCQEDK